MQKRHLNRSEKLSDVQILFFNKTLKCNSTLNSDELSLVEAVNEVVVDKISQLVAEVRNGEEDKENVGTQISED
mgnify:CR=1 FL=1